MNSQEYTSFEIYVFTIMSHESCIGLGYFGQYIVTGQI